MGNMPIHASTYLSLDTPIKRGLKRALTILAVAALMGCGGGGIIPPPGNDSTSSPEVDRGGETPPPEDDNGDGNGNTDGVGNGDGNTPSNGVGNGDGNTPSNGVGNGNGNTPSNGVGNGNGNTPSNGVGNGNGNTPSNGVDNGDGNTPSNGVGNGDGNTPSNGVGNGDGNTPSNGVGNGDGNTPSNGVGNGDGNTPSNGVGNGDGNTPSNGVGNGDGNTPSNGVGNGDGNTPSNGVGNGDGNTPSNGVGNGNGNTPSNGVGNGDGNTPSNGVGNGDGNTPSNGVGNGDGNTPSNGVGNGDGNTLPSVIEVRIGIHDTGVDINHPRFTDRIATTGAIFVYPTIMDSASLTATVAHLSDSECLTQSNNLCLYANQSSPYRIDVPPACIGSEADRQACARAMLANIPINSIPSDNDLTLYIYDKSVQITYRLPTAIEMQHGTAVASLAAESTAGSTTEAVIVPISINVSPKGSDELLHYGNFLDGVVNGNIDVLNRSFGIARSEESGYEDTIAVFKGATLDSAERNYWEAFAQIGVAPADKVVQVWAAGNEGGSATIDSSIPNQTAILPHYHEELRDHWVAVVATDTTGALAYYSNRCGARTAPDVIWNEAEHGLHYCLAASGEGQGAVWPNGNTVTGRVGTSFAAPRVTGAIAAVMQNARGQVRAVEALSRIKLTANRNGSYADTSTYGVGLLDLSAALNPVGGTSVSAANGLGSALQNAALRTHFAYGAAVMHGIRGIEITAFDELNYPFWHSASKLVQTAAAPIPPLWQRLGDEPAAAMEQAGLLKALRWLSVSGERHWSLRLTATENTLGISGAPFRDNHRALAALRFGLVAESETHHGVRSSGVFDAAVRSGLIFAGFDHTWSNQPPSRWALHSRLMIAAGKPDYEEGAMFTASGSLYSSAALTLQYANQDHRTRLRIEQPLRAETGQGVLHYAYGRTTDGTPQYRKHAFSLVPNGRALHVGLRHDRTLGAGRFAVELLHIIDQGHVRGNQRSQISTAVQLHW